VSGIDRSVQDLLRPACRNCLDDWPAKYPAGRCTYTLAIPTSRFTDFLKRAQNAPSALIRVDDSRQAPEVATSPASYTCIDLGTI
jgi:hypothetical protein